MEMVKDKIKTDQDPVPETGKNYILCAAIWIRDGQVHGLQPKNIDTGFAVCGREHRNCYKTGWIFNRKKVEYLFETNDGGIEGSLTSDDRFMDRKEGGGIAFLAGQTDKPKDCLFLEDLCRINEH